MRAIDTGSGLGRQSGGEVIELSENLKIGLCEDRRSKDTQNLKCEDRRLQNGLVLKTENLSTKPED